MKALIDGTGKIVAVVEDVTAEDTTGLRVEDWQTSLDPSNYVWPDTEDSPVEDATKPVEMARMDKLEKLKNIHSEKLLIGCEASKGWVDCDEAAQNNIVKSISLLENASKFGGPATTVDWIMFDNSVETHSLHDLVAMGLTVGAYVQGYLAVRQTLREAILAATTIAEIDGISISLASFDLGLSYVDPATLLSSAANIIQITVEENSGLNAGAAEWAHGNGANTPSDQGVVVPVDCELFATAASLKQGAAVIGIYINDVKVAEISSDDAVDGDVNRCLRTLSTPIQVLAGSVVGFKTVSASGTAGPNQVTAWLRSK